jgi:hypothetical protein
MPCALQHGASTDPCRRVLLVGDGELSAAIATTVIVELSAGATGV